MERYHLLVPNVYIPEPGIMADILEEVDLNGAVQYVSQLWSDMILFDHTDRENLLLALLHIMTNNPAKDEEMTQEFARIAWEIWRKVEDQPEQRTNKLKWDNRLFYI